MSNKKVGSGADFHLLGSVQNKIYIDYHGRLHMISPFQCLDYLQNHTHASCVLRVTCPTVLVGTLGKYDNTGEYGYVNNSYLLALHISHS